MTANITTLKQAADHLARNDSVLEPVILKYGPSSIRSHQNYYKELVESILGQQLSLKAAAAIEARFVALFEGTFPSPEQILARSIEQLRGVGLSRAKAAYIQDLARHIIDGTVHFDNIDSKSNAEIIKELTAVKGIGEWTVHMFLIFCMGRLDILAYSDLGIRNGIRKLYELDHAPSPQEVQDLATQNGWRPYESVACWYIWQSLDNTLAPANEQ